MLVSIHGFEYFLRDTVFVFLGKCLTYNSLQTLPRHRQEKVGPLVSSHIVTQVKIFVTH